MGGYFVLSKVYNYELEVQLSGSGLSIDAPFRITSSSNIIPTSAENNNLLLYKNKISQKWEIFIMFFIEIKMLYNQN